MGEAKRRGTYEERVARAKVTRFRVTAKTKREQRILRGLFSIMVIVLLMGAVAWVMP